MNTTQADYQLYHKLLSLPEKNLRRRQLGEPIVDGPTLIAAHRITATQELVAALKRIDDFVTKFREPWGSWKTPWWEAEVSDEAAFTADNALMHVANIARALSTGQQP